MSFAVTFEKGQDELALLVQQTEDGDCSALRSYAKLKELAELTSDAIKQIEPLALAEAETYGAKSFEAHGIRFELRNGATRYSYKGITEIDTLEAELKEAKEKYKQAFIARMKNLTAVTEDGEILQMPTVTYSKDSLIVKK